MAKLNSERMITMKLYVLNEENMEKVNQILKPYGRQALGASITNGDLWMMLADTAGTSFPRCQAEEVKEEFRKLFEFDGFIINGMKVQ